MPTVAAWSAELLAWVGAVAEPRWSPDGSRLAWVRGTPMGPILVVDGMPVPDVFVTGTRGGAFAWIDDDRLAVSTDGGLRSVRSDTSGLGPVVARAAGRASAPAVHRDTRRIAYVDETDDACRVMVAPLTGDRAPWAVSTADFAWDPAWSPDGTLLAWHEWDEPAMPWDASRIVVAKVDGTDPVVVAGGPGESVGQPRFAPTGPPRLACVSDRDGWTNVRVVRSDGSSIGVLAEPFEHAEPSWGPGQRSYAWSPSGERMAWCRNESGFGRLVDAPVPEASTAVVGAPSARQAKGWHHGLDWGVRGLVGVRSGARTPPRLVAYDASLARSVVDVAVGVDALPVADFVEPEPITWLGDGGTTVPGLRFTPREAETPPPLLVHLHGGPTDQSRVEWSPRIQYWVARGWAVLAPNPRGSTGYGRAHADALRGGWGEADVADVLAGIRAAEVDGWCDPARVALVGGSAGAFTALLAAHRAPDAVRAVVASYPVTDLAALAADTHRFERHYTDVLVGPRPARAAAWRDRSPLTHADGLRVPVLVLHGDADPVVPLAQSVAFVEAVRAGGGDATLHVYPGEGHGWKHPVTSADALQRTDDFLTRRVIAR